MNGRYTIKQDGEVIAQTDNLLTDSAVVAMLRFLAGVDKSWASAIAIGIGDTIPSVEDRRLNFEIGRGAVDLRAPDIINEAVIVKATIPRDAVGIIRELGVYSAANELQGVEGDALLADFNPEFMPVDDVYGERLRIGSLGMVIESPASDSRTVSLPIGFDISALGQDDFLALAYEADGLTEVRLRFMNSEEDYLSHVFTPSEGYGIERWRVTDFTSHGSGTLRRPIEEIRVVTTATAGGGTLILDGLRSDDNDIFADQLLISRALLDEPINKTNSAELEIEYSIQFNF